MNQVLYVTSFLIILAKAFGKCPNSCSGHGFCGLSNACSCYPGWHGGAADCSLRSCPIGIAWADKAYRTDAAHQQVECSNSGTCDRSLGLCKCYPGFTGSACQRVTCPNDCSGHGVCSSLHDIALYDGPDYDTRTQYSGDGVGIAYNNWDSNLIQLCECDRGYFGPDCSLVFCPKGDDPLTVNQNHRSIQWQIYSGSAFQGQIGLEFQGTRIFLPYTGLSSQVCSDLLSFNGKFGMVGCNYAKFGTNRITIQLVFYNWPVYPKDNNLYVNTGNPSIYDFFCDITYSNPSTYCQFTDLIASNVIEYDTCSNRGNCDYTTGVCSCFNGFGGPACSNATYLYNSGGANSPGLLVNSNAFNFSSSVLQIRAAKSPASDFYLLQALSGSNSMFFVRGDGLVGINKLKTLSGGQTISGGGLYVEEGGATVAANGMSVYSDSSTVPVAAIGSQYSGPLTSSYAALQISSLSSWANNFYLINGLNQGKSRFSVRADGALFVRGGGVQITSGLTVYSNGIEVTGGLTVSNSGLQIVQGGAGLTGGLTVYSNGLMVSSGGAQIYGGGSIYSGGMKIVGGATILSGGLSVTNGLSINNNGLAITGGHSVFSSGLAVTGGASIQNLGIRVSGGLTIFSGGGYAASGFSVGSGGLAVTGGIVCTGGLSVGTSLIASTIGVTVVSGGLATNGGLTVLAGPASVERGLTILSNGLSSAGGLTVMDTGVKVVSGGLSILTGGLFSTGGGTLTGNSVINTVTVTGSSIFNVDATFNAGVDIAGGLTVQGTTAVHYSPVVYSDRRLKTNLAPISDALKKVSCLQGLYYDWIQSEPDGMKFDERRHLGVIAQEVQKIIPEVVQQSPSSRYLMVDYSSLIPLLIEAIHELEKLLEDSTKRQQISEAEIKSLQNAVALLQSTT